MLAIVSDLHLQHVADDVLRYRDGDRVMGAGVTRNVSDAALQRFLYTVFLNARRHASESIDLVFAGDIFELHRTPLWLYGSNPVRPLDEPGLEDAAPDAHPLLAKVWEILGRIEDDNGAFFDVLQRFVRERSVRFGRRTWKLASTSVRHVRVHYLPGNHDRLANAWTGVRRRIRELLCIDPPDGRPLPYRFEDPAHGVRVRHGQEYDAANFALEVDGGRSLDATPEEYLRPCFGDYVTIDFAARLAVAFRAHHAAALRRNDAQGRRLRELYLALTEFDDVRPASLVIEYLAHRLGGTEAETFELLRPVLRDVVEAACANRFVEDEADRLGYWNRAAALMLREGLKHLSGQAMAVLARQLLGQSRRGAGPARIARHEPGLGGDVGIVIAGHTHEPEEVSLPAPGYYVNSGTWRTTLPFGEESFGRLRAYTMVFCYDAEERKRSDGRQFETWTGKLLEEQYGPYDEPVDAPAPGPPQRLRFTTLVVEQVDERRAELRTHFGVDGEERELAREGVRRGDELDLAGVEPVPLDPALDGEVWFRGLELDLGGLIDAHDLLPWALARLPRRKKRFRTGDGELLIRGWSAFAFRLRYRIEE